MVSAKRARAKGLVQASQGLPKGPYLDTRLDEGRSPSDSASWSMLRLQTDPWRQCGR